MADMNYSSSISIEAFQNAIAGVNGGQPQRGGHPRLSNSNHGIFGCIGRCRTSKSAKEISDADGEIAIEVKYLDFVMALNNSLIFRCR